MARGPTRVRTLWSQTNRQPASSERAGPSGMATGPLERSEQEALRKTEEGMAGADKPVLALWSDPDPGRSSAKSANSK